MNWLRNRLWHSQDGVAMLMVLGFMAISIPIVTGYLVLASTLTKDSRVKNSILNEQYAAQGCTQYAYYLVSTNSGYVDSLILGQPDIVNFDGCVITIVKVSENELLEVSYGDIVLTLDNSGSVSSSELVQLQEASNTIVEHFQPGMAQDTIRMGVSKFSGESASVVGMTSSDVHAVGSFVYVDDAFRSTNEPSYASGSWDSSAGQPGGGLKVKLGGIDDTDITDMSGGWRNTFNLPTQEDVDLSFRYNLTQDEEYESDEYSEVIVTVGSVQPGTGANDYVARITGDGSGGGSQTTGWQTFQVTLGSMVAGTHTLTIGGYNNKKTSSDESTAVLIDDIKVTVKCSVADCPPFIDSQFNTDSETLAYADDTFRSTSEPAYASGIWDASGGQSGGGLSVALGGIDGATILGMSGGWQSAFNLASPDQVKLSFAYNMVQDEEYENDENSEVIVTVDALQPGTGGNDYVARITGDGSGGSPQTTGWQTFQVDLGILSAGAHTLTIGGYNDKKTASNEITQVYIDDVVVAPACTTYCSPLLDENFPGNMPLHNGIDGLVQSAPDLLDGTNLVAGINGGAAQFITGLGDRISPPAPNLIVVITDGEDTFSNSDTDIENASAATGAEVFAIGVGSSITMPTLNAIASEPDVDHVFTISDYAGLLTIVDAIVAAVEGGLSIGTLITIESVGPDGTVSIFEVILPPP